jgi:alkylation response protein AidB-like acyl-CoA dehydrogenase
MDFALTEEHRQWRASVHAFCAAELQPHAAEFDARAELNADAVRKMAPLGLLGMLVPERYGGAELDMLGAALAVEELGWACGGTALSVAAHNGLGCGPLVLFGSDTQKQRWLPGLASGESGLGALALTEPGAGSDLNSVQTRAERSGDEWVIRGSKAWITNVGESSIVTTLCRTRPEAGSHSFSLIVVPVASSGLHVGPPEKKMGVRASPTYAITYDDVHVPADHVLGEPGQGLPQTLKVLDGGRISIGALSVGLARAAHEESIRYASERRSFGVPLAEHQAIQWMIADAATHIEAARLLVHKAAWLRDRGENYTLAAAEAKLFATEMAESVCRNAIQILGSYGYSSEYPVERLYRDARLMTIGEGTSEVQRMVIARRVLSAAH